MNKIVFVFIFLFFVYSSYSYDKYASDVHFDKENIYGLPDDESNFAQGIFKLTLLDDVKVADDALFFEGKPGVDYNFGKRITPHGDCIEYADGYLFVTWYKGGMDKRNLMVSRMKVGSGKWKTIEFPDQHIGYRGDPTKGDSHNTAAIGFCPADSTIHLVYDIHAYDETGFPDNFFNYRVTAKGGAFVSDEEWNISLFSAKKNHLNPSVNYARTTYPGFERIDNGRLMLKFRYGGSGKGNSAYTVYDGKAWSKDIIIFNNGMDKPAEDRYSIYGEFKYLHNKFHAGYSIRYGPGRDDKYTLNSGLYYAYTDDLDANAEWKTLAGIPFSIPLENTEMPKIFEPCQLGYGYRISMGPLWTVTKNGAVHFITTVNESNVHCYTKPSSHKVNYIKTDFIGELFCWDNTVLMIGLDGGYPFIMRTNEGESDWSELYRVSSGRKYRHCNVVVQENKIFIYLMEDGLGTAQPIRMLTFLIGTTNDIDGDNIRNSKDKEPLMYNSK